MIREEMRDRARELRADSTVFEQAFWACVRAKRLGGFKFRRQQVIGGYVVDFVCMEARLIVELDGDWHLEDEQRGYDAVRDEWLTAEGYRVMRVANREWMADQVGVLGKVEKELRSPLSNPQMEKPSPQPLSPTPLPRWERG
ncbi:MAG: endonuclease domain-containing protein [Thiolinea sp.]